VAAVIGTVGALNWLEGFVDKRIQSASVEGPPGPEGPTGPQGEAGPRGKNGDPSQFHLEDLLHGAVVAFDRSEDRSAQADTVNAGACPPGWQLFKPASGRFVIGAGNHSNADMNGKPLDSYPTFQDDKTKAVGGEETHKLTLDEMPKHTHPAPSNIFGTDILGKEGTFIPKKRVANDNLAVRMGKNTETAGSGEPHNNMPPYIALYFCKKT
jgi:hypothetical protein